MCWGLRGGEPPGTFLMGKYCRGGKVDEQIEPSDAADALSEIGRRREQVIRRAQREVFPGWFWWANAVLMIALAAAVESRRGVVLGIGIALFVVGSLVLNVPASRASRAAPPRR